MLIYISSGNGVDEVCRALWYFSKWLEKNYSFEIISIEKNLCKECYKSILLKSSDQGFKDLEGTHLWRSASPFRPKHKRKNWYFSLQCYEESQVESIDTTKIIYQTMKSPKKGGQHVNTTSSGVRALYPPLNIESISYDERSQHKNKKIAQDRLLEKVSLISLEKINKKATLRWKKGKEITRGNPVRVFEGARFQETKNENHLKI